jgi:hypothetical protein
MSVQLSDVQKGWSVIGADGKKIGEIDEVQPSYLKLHKGFLFKKDIYVPTAAVGQLRGEEVHLTVRESEIESLGWDTPPFAGEGRAAGSWTIIQRMPPGPDVAHLVENVFSRDALRVPIYGERVVVEKTPVITGELVITKRQGFEQTQAEANVRRLEVEVEERRLPSGRREVAPQGDATSVEQREIADRREATGQRQEVRPEERREPR